jgi:predicted phage terminase large subunit-like protein
MFRDASDLAIRHLIILAFRGSGKTTIMTTALPLWAIMGSMQTKFIVIVSQTQAQAQLHLKGIRMMLEADNLIRKDFGDLKYESDEWGNASILLPKYGAKIMAVSREQAIRGMHHGPHRPGLVISDDVEDITSVRTPEGRAATYKWYTSEILAIGDHRTTKYVTIGNLLHEDSLLMRLIQSFKSGKQKGTFRMYPIVKRGKPAWKGMFPTMREVQALKSHIGDRVSWEREFNLKVVSDEEQVITPDMLRYYDEIPDYLRNERYVIGVDLAISMKTWADRTAIITFQVYEQDDGIPLVYVLPQPINRKFNFTATTDALRELANYYGSPKIYIETVAYQAAVPEVLCKEGFDAEGVTPKADKRTRLSLCALEIERGNILFPRKGCKTLIRQLTGFGIERDDLTDAFTAAILKIFSDRDTWTGGRIIISTKNMYKGLGHFPQDKAIEWDE